MIILFTEISSVIMAVIRRKYVFLPKIFNNNIM